MAGTIFDPGPPPLGVLATRFLVCRNDDGELTEMPNVRFLGCRYDEGAMSGQAHYRYVFDEQGGVDVDRAWPSSPQQVTGPDAVGEFVLQPDDRLTAFAVDEEGNLRVLSDGFVTIPSGTISGQRNEAASAILCLETPIRCWDEPLTQKLQRDSDDIEDKDGDTPVDLPIVFNPKGKANATTEDHDGKTGQFDHPVFLDEAYCEDWKVGRTWTLPMAAKYILARGNSDEEYVENPDFSTLDDLLDAREPKGSFYDPRDSSTYDSKDIVLKETDIKGLEWPVALATILLPYGFTFEFQLGTKDDDSPSWRLRIYRARDDDPATYKQIFLQDGGDLDTSQTNVAEMHLSRDLNHVANEYVVETALREYESSFVLAPGFVPNIADVDNIKAFKLTGDDPAGDRSAYRRYVFDECGEGHYDFDAPGDLVQGEGTDLSDLILEEDEGYVKRRRKAKDTLFSEHAAQGDAKEKNKAVLCLSFDYAGPKPGLWDGSGTWHVTQKNWKFLDDCLGVYLNCENPEGWHVANPKAHSGTTAEAGQGIVKGISAQADPSRTHFTLMLTCVIEGDRVIEATAERRDASPTRFAIKRVIDARERYKKQVISAFSWFNNNDEEVVARDDTEEAKADATTRRAAHEMARLAGPVTIPWITFAYFLGDRLTHVVGRDQSLRTNLGDSGGEAPSYPRVVAIEFKGDPHPQTILHCEDDRGTERTHRGQQRGRRR